MLVNAPKRYYQLQRLHVYEEGGRQSHSGVNATLFGGSSSLGNQLGGMLTRIGSKVVYPYRKAATKWNINFRETQPVADLGYKAYIKLEDFTNEADIQHVIREDQNTVINCIGSRVFYKTEAEFEEANIKIPMAIANVVKRNPQIKRFIHVSAAGADPNSHSMRLRTKWIGEQEVKEICPDVTILRPTYFFNAFDLQPTIAAKWGVQMKMFNRMNFLVEGLNANVQPTFSQDVALAAYNAIKDENTIGEIYELGGPHTYTYEEIYEHFFHLTEIKPYTVTVPLETAYAYVHYKWWQSAYKKFFNTWVYPEFITAEAQNLVVSPGSKGYKDLGIKPVSFGHKAHELVNEIKWLYNAHEVTKRDTVNS
uniref:NmrA-like domain-containing protein n=1 Tax=Strombidium inclinatum TaxID=197538 RepID=A0A7S3INA2_9SPIT